VTASHTTTVDSTCTARTDGIAPKESEAQLIKDAHRELWKALTRIAERRRVASFTPVECGHHIATMEAFIGGELVDAPHGATRSGSFPQINDRPA
jgi:hypothetical protein